MHNRPTVHKYQLKQMVRLLRTPIVTKGVAAPTDYEIVRLMPADANGEISYRIKAGSAELAVREHEITL
jgi:hypothetical protein